MKVVGHEAVAKNVNAILFCVFFHSFEELVIIARREKDGSFFRTSVIYMVVLIGCKKDLTSGH